MRKLLIGGLAALTFATGALAPAAEAQAQNRYYYRHRHHDDDGAAIAAGIAGLAIGAALASGSSRRSYGYYDYGPRGYYDEGYRGRGYSGAPRYYRPYAYGYDRRCRTTSYWDDWNGGYIERTRCW